MRRSTVQCCASFQHCSLTSRYQIAASLSMQRYALVFGVNTFGALLFGTLITVVVVDSAGLGLDVVTQVTCRLFGDAEKALLMPGLRLTAACLVSLPQFFIYGGYFAVISVVFLLAGLYRVFSSRRTMQEVNGESSPPSNGAVTQWMIHLNALKGLWITFSEQTEWCTFHDVLICWSGLDLNFLFHQSINDPSFPLSPVISGLSDSDQKFNHRSQWVCFH